MTYMLPSAITTVFNNPIADLAIIADPGDDVVDWFNNFMLVIDARV